MVRTTSGGSELMVAIVRDLAGSRVEEMVS